MTKEIVLNALLMAVWRRNPQKQVLVHSDQGSQYTSHEWQSFLKSHGLEGSMSRRGNCHDNAVAESFFQLLKRERIKKKIYGTREGANKRGNSSRLTQSFHFFMFEPIFSPVNALNQPI